jgi:hypothetical protein
MTENSEAGALCAWPTDLSILSRRFQAVLDNSERFEAGDVSFRNTVIILNPFVKDYVFDGTPPVTLV